MTEEICPHFLLSVVLWLEVSLNFWLEKHLEKQVKARKLINGFNNKGGRVERKWEGFEDNCQTRSLTLTLVYCPVVHLLPRREEAIRAIEEEIRRERRVADEVVQSMSTAKQEKYFTMASANEELLQV